MLFRLEKKTAVLVAVFLCLFLSAFVAKCRAADFTFNGGSTVLRGTTQTIGLRVTWPKVVAERADIEAGMQLIGTSDFKGAQPSQAVILAQLVNGLGPVDFGMGPAFLQNEDSFNSGKFCFALMARWNIAKRYGVQWMHISNAGTHSPNVGRDMVLASYRF